jgi:hypothetical protein
MHAPNSSRRFSELIRINDVTAVTQQSGPSFGLATAIVLPRIVAFSAHDIF